MDNILELYNEIYDEYYKKVFAFFRRDFSKEDSEDLVQQVFMRLWQWLANTYAVKNIKSLIFSIAKNVRTDMYRKNMLKLECNELIEELDLCDNSDFTRIAEYKMLISKLTDKERYLLLLSYEGYDSNEIANKLNLNSSTVRTRLQRIRKKIR